ncbi:MAG: hypothetical protein ACXWIZ_11335 [Caldimonas sp.]
MLRLSWEQFDRLEQLTLKRHAASISGVLAETWPALTERLQDRWPAFVEAAVQQGRKHGLQDARDLARYASLWCVWGPSFDTKPAFAWAAEILADPRRSAALKLHQLGHRTRDELQKRHAAAATTAPAAGAPVPLTTAQFEAALAGVEAKIGTLAAARAVFPAGEAKVAFKACDLGTIDMMVAEAENLQEYRHAANGWHRAAAPKAVDAAAVKWTHAPDAPVELAVTSHALRGGAPARLNLRINTVAVCDPRVHPEVVHSGAEGRLAWKGRDTARLSLALYAPPPAPLQPNTAPPGIAAPVPFDRQTVHVASCGLRDAGAPFGDVSLQVQVYEATQWLAEVRHPAWQPMIWPAGTAVDPATPGAICKLEKDGAPADASAWQRGWVGLHAAFRAGLERLYNEWARVLDNQATRLEVEASPLVGQAGLTGGWRRAAAANVVMRTEGVLDLLALSIDLRLSGELVDGTARSRIRVHCKGRSELRMAIAQLGDQAAEGQGLKAALRNWRFPFTLEIEPLAGAEPATLSAAAVPMPVTGALIGECGLRVRADGGGQQWFFALRVEPVTVVTDISDPVLGGTRQTRKIFPAMTLVDWSAG